MKLFGTKHGKYEGRHTSPRRSKRRRAKSLLPLCLVLILGVCLTIGGTLAFMQETTGPVTNTFKAGDITYTLNLEPNAQLVNRQDSDVTMPSALSAQTVRDLSVIFSADKTPMMTGYTFEGWYYDNNCTEMHTAAPGLTITVQYGDSYDSNDEANKVALTLYAKWTANNYTIKYDANTGNGSMDDTTAKYDQGVTLSENAFTKTGYTFTGWNTKANGSGTYHADKATVKNLVAENGGEITLYAQWQPITYTVVYDKNGNDTAGITGSTASSTHTYDVMQALTDNGYERTGYTFIGWNTKSDGTGNSYANKESVKNLTTEPNGTVTLYAQWDAKSYVIRYHANGGTGTMVDQTIEYNKPTVLSKNQFTKDDYTFGGWALSSTGTATYIDEDTVVNLQESGTLDLYAVWIQNSHTVTFDYNGGTGSPSSKQVQAGKVYGKLPEYPVHERTKTGTDGELMSNLFTGWYTEAEGGTRVYPSDTVTRTDDHTLYAHWKEAPTNNIIQNMTVKNNPDDNKDGVVDAFYVNLTCSSYYEKYNIPLENLVVGQTYKLSFTESNNATYGETESGYMNAIYGFIITTQKTLTGGSIKDESCTDGGLIKSWTDRNDGALNGPRNWETTFTAEATTMYWTWDYGLIQDGHARDYNYTNIQLVPVEPEIGFSSKTVIKGSSSAAEIASQSNSTYGTTFTFDGASGCETVYWPITDLSVGMTYTITFDHEFSGPLIHDTANNSNPTYEYGCGIMNAAPSKTGDKMTSLGTWASNTFVKKTVDSKVDSVTLTFTATGSTAYWVWNMANCSDNAITTTKVTVTSFSASNAGSSVTYYTAESKAGSASCCRLHLLWLGRK